MAIEAFKRRERKYVISREQYETLVKQLSPYMRPDKFGDNGKYTVTSLYFESPDYKVYHEIKNKAELRRKLRLRVYNEIALNDIAFFELKLKHKDNVIKRRSALTLAEAYRYLTGSGKDSLESYQTSNTTVFREIDQFRKLYNLHPEMIISYYRHALHGMNDPELRITFDFNLRCRNDDLYVENGPYGESLPDTDIIILEVKTNEHMPFWLTQILQNLQCEQKKLSKFCTSLGLLKNERPL